jgi:hypothetical protein
VLNLPDLMGLYAELAIAIAGFSGVASAFAGRDRDFRPTERIRLMAVLSNSAGVFAGCLAFYVAAACGLSADGALRAAGAASLAFALPIVLILVPGGWRGLNAPGSTTELWVMCIVSVIAVVFVALYAAAAFLQIGPAPLVAGFSIQMLFALWMFVRLLVRPN